MTSTPLSARLRELRRSRWPGEIITQTRVAQALGVKEPSISAYERGESVPPPERLRDYAVFFASRRWLDPDAPLRVDRLLLDPDERKICAELNTELTDLRPSVEATRAVAPTATPAFSDFWRFPDGGPIRILCGRLDTDDAGPYAAPADHNYMRLRNAADLDSLVELWGHIWRSNPDSDVQYVVGKAFTEDDLGAHLVVLGNIARSQGAGLLIPDTTLPVRQVRTEEFDGEVFEVDRKDGTVDSYAPLIKDGQVVQDVGLLARVPNPHNSARTLTVCSGVFTRGVYGAVRTLTDEDRRDGNGTYLRKTFGTESAFGLLMRVRVVVDAVPTPDLGDKDNRLFEFPELPS